MSTARSRSGRRKKAVKKTKEDKLSVSTIFVLLLSLRLAHVSLQNTQVGRPSIITVGASNLSITRGLYKKGTTYVLVASILSRTDSVPPPMSEIATDPLEICARRQNSNLLQPEDRKLLKELGKGGDGSVTEVQQLLEEVCVVMGQCAQCAKEKERVCGFILFWCKFLPKKKKKKNPQECSRANFRVLIPTARTVTLNLCCTSL